MVFIIVWGKQYQFITKPYAYPTYTIETIKKKKVLIFFGIFVISNDNCWVICMLLSNVKSLFDHVTIQYTIVKPTLITLV